MFVGPIPQAARNYLAANARKFATGTLVMGCSGSFSVEAAVATWGNVAAIHSNDVSLYSCAIGTWLTGGRLPFEITDPDYQWANEYRADAESDIGVLGALMEIFPFEKRDNPHKERMYDIHRRMFGDTVARTAERLREIDWRVSSFYPGDVFDHYRLHEHDPDPVFICSAPTYLGGYERLYRRFGEIIVWDQPSYDLLDDARKEEIFRWLEDKRYIWWTDTPIEGKTPAVIIHNTGRKVVYAYSSIALPPAIFRPKDSGELPNVKFADKDLVIGPGSRVDIVEIPPKSLRPVKDMFLAKGIDHRSATWAFAVLIDGQAIGFFEIANRTHADLDHVLYLQSDFAVAGTRYKRLSKLVIMLILAYPTRRMLEIKDQLRKRQLLTTVFTDKPVSMKYRGVFKKWKRGVDKDGRKYINYVGQFNDATYQEVLQEWLKKHGSKVYWTS